VEGPSEAEITCHDNKDGTCTVDYVPTEEGDYDVTVKFGDENIPGSPFKASPTLSVPVKLHSRVARFFLVHDTKAGKMYQMNTKCIKWS
jgi:hypothetical protein